MMMMMITQWHWERLEGLVKECPRSPIIKTPSEPRKKEDKSNPLPGTSLTITSTHTHPQSNKCVRVRACVGPLTSMEAAC